MGAPNFTEFVGAAEKSRARGALDATRRREGSIAMKVGVYDPLHHS